MEKINLKFEEVKAFAKEVEEIGRTMFLVKHNAIKVLDDGSWAIKHYEGLKLSLQEAFAGHVYETDVPYDLWREVLQQVEYYISRRDKKAKVQAEATK